MGETRVDLQHLLEDLRDAIPARRKAIQEVVARQLAEWGDRRDEESRPRMARLERYIPLLQSLVERRIGGQKRLPMPGRGHERAAAPLFEAVGANHRPTDEPAHGAPPPPNRVRPATVPDIGE